MLNAQGWMVSLICQCNAIGIKWFDLVHRSKSVLRYLFSKLTNQQFQVTDGTNEETENHDVQHYCVYYMYHANEKKKKKTKFKIAILMHHIQLDRAHSGIVLLLFSFLWWPSLQNCLVSNISSMENGMNTTNQNELICLIIRYLHRFNGEIERK